MPVLKVLMILTILMAGCNRSPDIRVQNMTMEIPGGSRSIVEELLQGEIADTRIEHIAYSGPSSNHLDLPEDSATILLFIKGTCTLQADITTYRIVPESIAVPFSFSSIALHVPEGDTLHFLQFKKKLTPQDTSDLKTIPSENKFDIYVKNFIDCEPYTEKIKSPNTISRTVLPADIIPRVSLGTVASIGPDEVGAHEHPMLDQLFLGLAGNDIVVHAGEESAELKEFSLLHIPVGSSHWASVEKEKRMYYMWMDFFLTREGQEWLKTHKPISTSKKK